MIRALFYALCLIILFPMTQTLANEDTITTNSATQKTDEQKTFEDVLRSATSETAVFSLLDEDILSWEENDTAQFLYFALAEDRVRELALLVEEQKGKRLHINFGENFILVPEITDSFLQKDGFALFLNNSERKELIYSMLDRSKRAESITRIKTGTTAKTPEQ